MRVIAWSFLGFAIFVSGLAAEEKVPEDDALLQQVAELMDVKIENKPEGAPDRVFSPSKGREVGWHSAISYQALDLLQTRGTPAQLKPLELHYLCKIYNWIGDTPMQLDAAEELWNKEEGSDRSVRWMINSLHNAHMFGGDTQRIVEFADLCLEKDYPRRAKILKLKAMAMVHHRPKPEEGEADPFAGADPGELMDKEKEERKKLITPVIKEAVAEGWFASKNDFEWWGKKIYEAEEWAAFVEEAKALREAKREKAAKE